MARDARGSTSNPQSRFDRVRYDAELIESLDTAGLPRDPDEPEPDPRTVYLPDPSRTIVARNESPDVGFNASINPYRGCEHACSYCLAPDTPVLYEDLTWHPVGVVRVGDVLLGFEEQAQPGRNRKLRPATVEATWASRQPTWRIVTKEGEVTTTAEHRWVDGADRWTRTRSLAPGQSLHRTPMVHAERLDDDYRAGYAAGFSIGDGPSPLEERDTRSWRRGFVAGFFDAEGHNGDSLRISQVDLTTLERMRRYAKGFGFDFVLEPRPGLASTIRLVGTTRDRLRFFATFQPAIRREWARLYERRPDTALDPIVAIEPAGMADVVDLQTSSRTFFAAGLATHNCYARPTHEYLGFSAGVDFETKILVKHEAPALLRKALASPRWKPTTLALSGVTDAYQPVERKLGLTRRVLEVLAEYRNPVAVVTKSWTVTRDADVLAALAAHGAASVVLSVTTLDAELQRKMEPRAAPPARRLAAIEALAKAGVPVGVLVAPIVPGLTDHEIPRILEAAASAGARYAGRVVLRLPHGLKALFEEWLEQHFPERREKVLNRLRALHGGELYDPTFRHRQRGSGVFADQIAQLFDAARRRAGLAERGPELSTAAFRRPSAQGSLFD